MKLHRLLIIALGILCVTTESFSSDPASYGLEIFIRTRNTGGQNIVFKASMPYPNDIHWSTHGWLTSGMTEATLEINGDYDDQEMGFDLDSTQASVSKPQLGYATYIISIESPSSKVATVGLISNGWYFTGDKWLLYDYGEDKFYLTTSGSMTPLYNITGSSIEINSDDDPQYCSLQPTDPTDLTVVSSNGHPYLSWTEGIPASGTKYKIYRNSSLIYTTSIGQTNWTDEEVNIQSGLSNISYKVRAYCADDTRSKSSNNYTNTVVTGGTYEGTDNNISIVQIIPQSTAIRGIYPNPFNPETKIRYSLSEPLDTKLSVYNVLGDEKQILVNERKYPGEYEVYFNGKDLPSGTYFVVLQSGNTTETRRIMLLK